MTATLLKLNFFTGIFQRFWSYNQLDTLYNSYFEKYLFLHNIFFNDFFPLLKLLHAIAKSCQINWRIERTKTYGSIFLQRLNITKIKLVVGNSVITEVKELKDISHANFSHLWP